MYQGKAKKDKSGMLAGAAGGLAVGAAGGALAAHAMGMFSVSSFLPGRLASASCPGLALRDPSSSRARLWLALTCYCR